MVYAKSNAKTEVKRRVQQTMERMGISLGDKFTPESFNEAYEEVETADAYSAPEHANWNAPYSYVRDTGTEEVAGRPRPGANQGNSKVGRSSGWSWSKEGDSKGRGKRDHVQASGWTEGWKPTGTGWEWSDVDSDQPPPKKFEKRKEFRSRSDEGVWPQPVDRRLHSEGRAEAGTGAPGGVEQGSAGSLHPHLGPME